MRFDHADSPGRQRLLAAGAGLAALAAGLFGLEVASTARTPFEEGPPLLGSAHWARSAAIAGLGAGTIVGARALAIGRLEARPATEPPAGDRTREWLAAGVGVAVTVGATVLLGLSPQALSALAREDGPVEWGSAGLLAVAAVMAGRAGVRWCRQPLTRPGEPGTVSPNPPARSARRLTGAACLLGALSFLVMALEEVSFFQRQLGFTSPPVLVAGRGQPELNLHNFATNLAEQLYYLGAFVLCVALPAVLGDRRLRSPRWRWLEPLIPPSTVLYGVVTAAGLTYEMWNTLPIQLAFWASLAALLLRALEQERRLDLALAVAMVATLAAFLSKGHTMIRTWDDTEIRELLVPLGLVLYGRSLGPADAPDQAGAQSGRPDLTPS